MVSVVIPNFNHGRFLERRLQSVLDQTYPDFEVIILDDASTDNSREIIEGYRSHPKVAGIEYNEQNSGNPFKQWNKGVRLARGQYVWIAEADDFADERFLETLTAILDAHPHVGFAYCQSNLVDEQDKVIGSAADWTRDCDPKRWQSDFVNTGTDECARYLLHQNTIPNSSAVLFRRANYEQAGMADETMRFCADWLMWVRILLNADVAFVAQPHNFYRRHTSSVTSKVMGSQQALMERVRVLSEILHHVSLQSSYDLFVVEADGSTPSRNPTLWGLLGERDWLAGERARLAKERDQLSWERDVLKAKLEKLEGSVWGRVFRRVTRMLQRKET